MTIKVYKIRYCAEKILVQILTFNSKFSKEMIKNQLHPLKHVNFMNNQICIPVITSRAHTKTLKELFHRYLSKIKNVQLTDFQTLSNINWTRFISPMEQEFEDISRWNRNILLDLSPPPWMVPEEIIATKKEIEELTKKQQNARARNSEGI